MKFKKGDKVVVMRPVNEAMAAILGERFIVTAARMKYMGHIQEIEEVVFLEGKNGPFSSSQFDLYEPITTLENV